MKYSTEQERIINTLCTSWGVNPQQLEQTGAKFFEGYKAGEKAAAQLQQELLSERVRARVPGQLARHRASESAPTRYLTELGEILHREKPDEKQLSLNARLVFEGHDFLVFAGDAAAADAAAAAAEQAGARVKKVPLRVPKGCACADAIVMATGVADARTREAVLRAPAWSQ